MSQNGKLMPNLDQQSTKLLNLAVLRRIDPFIEEILITAAHVTFYEFNIDLSIWSRKDVEGSLFVVKRILNAYSKVPQKSKVATSKIEFEELEAVPTMAVMDGPLESTPSNAADVPEDPAFVKFFSTALTAGNTSNAAISAQPYQSNTTISLPSHPASVASPIVPTLQIPSPPLSAPTPNLVKPSLFFVPPPSSYARMMQFVSSSTPTAPPLNPPLSVAAHMVPQCLNLFHHQPLHHLLLLLLLQTADHLSARRKSERHFWCLFRTINS
ncbi:hypothetical protein AB3S75_039689 [Citrus x aurantiifolia]